MDDRLYFLEDPATETASGIFRIWFAPLDNNGVWPYLPITRTSFWLERQIFGVNLAVSHWINILLHGSGAVLLWIALRQWTIRGAWFIALLFAAHPIYVQSVAWIAQRKNGLAGIFFILALWAFARFLSERNLKWYLTLLGLFLAALLSKTSTVMLPVLFVLLHTWKHHPWSKKEVWTHLPFFLLALGIATLRVWFETQAFGAHGDEFSGSWLDQLLIASHVPFFYLKQLVIPYPLLFTYPRWIFEASQWTHYFPLFSGLIVLGWLCFYFRTWGRPLLLATLGYGAMLFPVMGFFDNSWHRFSYVADHWIHLPSLAVWIVLVQGGLWLLDALSRKDPQQTRWMRWGCGGIIVLLCATLTWNQTHVYRNSKTLYETLLRHNPLSWVAYSELGLYHLHSHQYGLAYQNFSQELSIRESPMGYMNRGLAAYQQKQLQQALRDYSRAIELNPSHAPSYGNRAVVYLDLGKYSHALQDCEKSIQLQPQNPQAYQTQGLVYWNLKQYALAVKSYTHAIEQAPQSAIAYNNRGLAYHQLKQTHQAMQDFQEGCRLGDCRYWNQMRGN